MGDHGEIEVRIGSADGSITKELEIALDYGDAIVDVEVTLAVDKGSYRMEFLGEDQEVTLTLEASNGEQASGTGYVVTDTFGEAQFRVTAEEAEGVSYHINYRVR